MTAKLQQYSTATHFGVWGDVYFRLRCDECKVTGQPDEDDAVVKASIIRHNTEEHS